MSRKVYFERQKEPLLCGLHAVNNLLQGPYFNNEDLRGIAEQHDQKARKEFNINQDDLLKMGVDAQQEGFYTYSVIEECLLIMGLTLSKWTSGLAAPHKEQGFLVNTNKHWYVLRKVESVWYVFDSLKSAPRLIPDLLRFIDNEVLYNRNIINAIRSKNGAEFPRSFPQIVNGRLGAALYKGVEYLNWRKKDVPNFRALLPDQCFLDDAEIEKLHNEQRRKDDQETWDAQRIGNNDDDSPGFCNAAPLVKKVEHKWSEAGEGKVLNQNTQVPPPLSNEIDDDLAIAMALSMQTFAQEMNLPPEPAEEDVNAIELAVHMNKGTMRRRFLKSSNISEVFLWLEKFEMSLVGANEVTITAQFPKYGKFFFR
eukprot:GHVP01031143.1.p1 GENE.GHVP01031143.1~~GHVP01031143.1.p1  ORF type:complete len:368 (-),score=74.73 GHVP01031143.1:249-1352(-)